MNVEKLKRYHVYGEDDYHGTIIDEDSEGEFIKYSDLRNEVMKDCYNQEKNTCSIELTKEQIKLLFEISKNEVSDEWSVSKLLGKALEEMNTPQIGDRCVFWDDNKDFYFVGYLESYADHKWMYETRGNGQKRYFKNCTKIEKEAIF